MNDSSGVTQPTRAGPERAIVVGVELKGRKDGWTLEGSVAELAALADSAGLVVVGRAAQRLDAPNPATYIGSGKVEELRGAVADLSADVVLIDDELSPRQQRNLEAEFAVKVLDRTALILDVFAQHARTREGMLQVELAQYEYRLPRLTRMWTHLARQAGGRAGGAAGGVGVRGPGETQLEIDRREIGRRIRHLRGEIESLRSQRKLHRRRRRRAGLPVVALVGYTNAGKSTLLNALSEADVYVADQLFATLDPTTRRVPLPSGRLALFTDTVGFMQKLPTELVAAFRATLEELSEADMLLHVVDVTHPDAVQQVETVEQVLAEMGLDERRMVVAANKVDRLPATAASDDSEEKPAPEGSAPVRAEGERIADSAVPPGSDHPNATSAEQPDVAEPYHAALERIADLYPDLVPISALRASGLDELLAAVDDELMRQLVTIRALIPYSAGELLHRIHSHGVVDSEEYVEQGTRVRARVPSYLLGGLEDHLLAYSESADGEDDGNGSTEGDASGVGEGS